jgi:hypothetical protein
MESPKMQRIRRMTFGEMGGYPHTSAVPLSSSLSGLGVVKKLL